MIGLSRRGKACQEEPTLWLLRDRLGQSAGTPHSANYPRQQCPRRGPSAHCSCKYGGPFELILLGWLEQEEYENYKRALENEPAFVKYEARRYVNTYQQSTPRSPSSFNAYAYLNTLSAWRANELSGIFAPSENEARDATRIITFSVWASRLSLQSVSTERHQTSAAVLNRIVLEASATHECLTYQEVTPDGARHPP